MQNIKQSMLAALLLVSLLLTACGDAVESNSDDSAETSASDDETTAGVDEYGREIIAHGLPDDLDFGGMVINCLVRDLPSYSIDFGVEELNGDIVNDAVYERNGKVEDELNIDINIITVPDTNTTTSEAVGDLLRTSVMAGERAYDVCAFYQIYGSSLGLDGMLYNINELNYVDFTQPWWNQDFYEELSYQNQLYYMVGSMNLSVTSSLMGVFFNQTKVTDYYGDYDFLYQLVYDGEWTLDKFSELVRDVYTDLDGDGAASENDFYGLTMVEDDPGPWNAALNIRLCTKDETGTPRLSFYSERSVTAYEKLYSLYRNSTGVYFGAKGYDYKTAFASGKSLFAVCSLESASTHLRDMTDGYGLLPMPKFDTNQEKYQNSARDSSNLTGVAVDCDKLDAVGAMLELMNYYSYYNVTPAYYEVAMKTKYLADSDSANMFDLILDGVVVDFGEIYSLAISGGQYSMDGIYAGQMRNLIRLKITDLGSNYAKFENIYESCLDEIIATYDELAAR